VSEGRISRGFDPHPPSFSLPVSPFVLREVRYGRFHGRDECMRGESFSKALARVLEAVCLAGLVLVVELRGRKRGREGREHSS
jgi:hypothetical protein